MKRPSLHLIVLFILFSISSPSFGLENQWFVGIGGGTSWLVPNPVNPAIDDSENAGTYGTLYLGRDLGNFSSFQVQFHSLGTAVLTNQEEVDYSAMDASILYRFYDSRDSGFDRDAFGISFYGRFGLGGIMRDSPASIPLKNKSDVYFSGGAGFEIYFNPWLALRLEGAYLDEDAAYGGISLLTRFGGGSRPANRPPQSPSSEIDRETKTPSGIESPGTSSTVENEVDPATTEEPQSSTPMPTEPQPEEPLSEPNPVEAGDQDADGVLDSTDECPDSLSGFPVRSSGCAVFNGVLRGVLFAEGTASLQPASFEQLDYLANLLLEYPDSRIQILAHTDSLGSVRDQSILTRGRLRTLGTYLVRKGVRANRMVLRSLGGSRPAYDNTTEAGRAANNRIELLEYQ